MFFLPLRLLSQVKSLLDIKPKSFLDTFWKYKTFYKTIMPNAATFYTKMAQEKMLMAAFSIKTGLFWLKDISAMPLYPELLSG